MSPVTNNRLILKNTLMLYIRQALILFVGLYTSRLVLKALGVVDFGIFNVVAGIVTMLGFLSNAMTTACQRYFSFDIGKEDEKHLKRVYDTSFFIYFVIALVIALICETAGLWLVKHKLIIPAERLNASEIVLHLSVLTFFVTVMTTPFTAIITAYEDMAIYAWMSIFECVIKLLLIFLLSYNTCFDNMILYGLILAGIAVSNFFLYGLICLKKYVVCRGRFFCDILLAKELFQYVVWNMLSGISGALYNQGVNLVLNVFCGPVVNSARAIAAQVNGAVASFSSKFSTAVQPQLTKNYAVNAFDDLYTQLYRSIKFLYALMFIFVLPLSLEIHFVLRVWLGEYPAYTAIFTVLTLFSGCIDVITYPLDTLNQATGKVKAYQFFTSVATLANLPLAIGTLAVGFQPYSVVIINIVLRCIAVGVRLFVLRSCSTGFYIRSCLRYAVLPIILFTVFSVPVPLFFKIVLRSQILCFFIVVISSVCMTVILGWLILLCKNERFKLHVLMQQKLKIFAKRGV